MSLTRRSFLAAGVLLLGPRLVGCASALGTEAGLARGERALAGALGWLASRRSRDGLYPSRHYGLLRGGASTTPFVLLALDAADALSDAEARASLAALAGRCDERGALGLREAAADYPCYASGMLLTLLARRAHVAPPGLADRTRAWLLDQQLSRANGWRDHPAQGGWGMGASVPRKPPDAGHVDLSMTRRVIDGLVASGLARGHPALEEARDFVLRCQTGDGSFVYSPVERSLNKGHRSADASCRGYGSATTDGWLALDALGLGGSKPAVRALSWLRARHRVDVNPGVEGGPMHAFADAMRGYYRAGSAACFARTAGPSGWRARLAEAIADEQREDGSFANPSPLQKEDDPLIATAFAIGALGWALRAVAG